MFSARVKNFLINLLIALVLAAVLFGGFFIFRFNKKIEETGYKLLGKMFPGPHVKEKGTEVRGFVDGRKVDHLAGVVKNIEFTMSEKRLTIEWEGDSKVVFVDPKASVYFGSKDPTQNSGNFTRGDIKGIKVGDHVMLRFPERRPNGETNTRLIMVVR